jgi:hypothetical protein
MSYAPKLEQEEGGREGGREKERERIVYSTYIQHLVMKNCLKVVNKCVES